MSDNLSLSLVEHYSHRALADWVIKAEAEVDRLREALFRAKGAIPSDRGELHRELAELLNA